MQPLGRLAPRRIALVKPSALGDIVHALPVLSALRARFPHAAITWVVNKSYEPLLAGHPDLTDTLAFDRGAARRGVRGAVGYAARFAAELRRRQFDLVIDLQGLLRTGLMCLATGAPRRVGFAAAREGSRLAYTDRVRVPDADRIHAVDRYWRMVEALGAGDVPKRFHVPIPAADLEWARAQLAGLPRPVIAVAVGAKWVTKRWPPSHFAALLKPLAASCIFVGTGDDTALSLEVIRRLEGPAVHLPSPLAGEGGEPQASRVRGTTQCEGSGGFPSPGPLVSLAAHPLPQGERVKTSSTTALDLTGKTTLPQLAALLASCDAMVGNDTGPLHLAAALGTPCVAPYTCTRVRLHGPYGSFAGGVETSAPCGGSYLKTCPNMVCMADLTPDRLRPRLAEVLDTWANTCRSA
jgi:ADP-heptose:LPS heptosyltransferase